MSLDFSDHTLLQIGTWATVGLFALALWEKDGPTLRTKALPTDGLPQGILRSLWENKTLIAAVLGVAFIAWINLRQTPPDTIASLQSELKTAIQERDTARQELHSGGDHASASSSNGVNKAEILSSGTDIAWSLLKLITKTPVAFSITAPSDNDPLYQNLYHIIVKTCNIAATIQTKFQPCSIEPIQPYPTHPTLENPLQKLPEPQYPGIVIHNTSEGAGSFDQIYDGLFEALGSAGCMKVQRSTTTPPIVSSLNITNNPNFFWMEIGHGEPWANSNCWN